jgi:hypothetical protein
VRPVFFFFCVLSFFGIAAPPPLQVRILFIPTSAVFVIFIFQCASVFYFFYLVSSFTGSLPFCTRGLYLSPPLPYMFFLIIFQCAGGGMDMLHSRWAVHSRRRGEVMVLQEHWNEKERLVAVTVVVHGCTDT